MQDNSFITKMTGRGELPIGKMPGFEPPDDETHEIILERFKKQMRKETVSTVFWTIMSLFFIITYIVMYFRMDAKADAKKGILVALAAFVVIAVVTIYKYVFIDKKADAIVNEKKYKVAPAMIHHIMPGFGTRLGKLTVKICDAGDDNVGNVYNYEFVINKKVSKAYRKNKDIILTVIEIDKQKELYSLTYIDEADKDDKDAAEEDMEK